MILALRSMKSKFKLEMATIIFSQVDTQSVLSLNSGNIASICDWYTTIGLGCYHR